MKSFLKELFTKYRFVFIAYLLLSFLLFLKLFISRGSVIGSDWGLPDNSQQVKVFFDLLRHSWSRTGNFLGTRQLSQPLLIAIGPLLLFAKTGVPISLLIKVFIVLVFTLSASNLNLLLRYIGLKPASAFIGGLVFIFSPLYFNYVLIGWIYVLLALGMLPLFIYLFLLALDKDNYLYSLLAALVFSLAAIQSQAVVWYSIVLIILVVVYGTTNHCFSRSLKFASLIFFAFLILNFYWLPAMLLFPDQGAIGSNLVNSSISVGTSQRLSAPNLLRTWGSLYNFQFETGYSGLLQPISFMIPLIGFCSLFFLRKYKKHLSYFLAIFLVPVIFYLIGRQLISHLPFANLIRDVARFSTLSTLALAAMVAITYDQLSELKIRQKHWLSILVVLVLLLNLYPFWSGQLFSIPVSGFDFRLRTKVWPPEYQEFNDKLSVEDPGERAVSLQLGGLVSLSNDLPYNGPYHEIPDIYSAYAPISSAISFSDRSQGASSELISELAQSVKDQNINQFNFLVNLIGAKFIVYRRDMDYYDWSEQQKREFETKLLSLIESGQADKYFDSGAILALKLKNPLPQVSANNQLIEISSNQDKIIPYYTDPLYFDSSQLKKIADFKIIASILGDKSLYTFDEQNRSYSLYKPQSIAGYKFLSLDELSEKISLLKWNYVQKNLDLETNSSAFKDNQKIINSLSGSQNTSQRPNRYAFYPDQQIRQGTIYFQSSSAESQKIVINGEIRQTKIVNNTLQKVEIAGLASGFNIIEVGSEVVKPVILVIERAESKDQPPDLTFKRINSADYLVNISAVKNDFYLNFSENYDSFWRLTDRNGILAKSVGVGSDHFVSNGFGNGYKITLSDLIKEGVLKQDSDGSYNGKIHLLFWPERFQLLFSSISFAGLTLITILLFKGTKNGK